MAVEFLLLENGVDRFLLEDGSGVLQIEGQTATRAWTPADIPVEKRVAWYDAQDAATITQAGGAVSQWTDKYGLRNISQGVASRQPAYSATGFAGTHGGIIFTEDSLSGLMSGLGDNLTVVLVVKNNGGSPSNARVFSIAPPTGLDYNDPGGVFYLEAGMVASYFHGAERGTRASIGTEPGTLAFTWSNGSQLKRVNGAASSSSTLSIASTFATMSRFAIGESVSNVFEHFQGVYAEVVVLKDATLDDIERAEAYGLHRRNLQGTLDAGHTYKAATPTIAPVASTSRRRRLVSSIQFF